MERFLHLLHKAIALFLGLREGLLSPSLLGTWKISAVRVLDEEERVGTIKSGAIFSSLHATFICIP